ncbi:HNH endonuclease [Betaproteobacteria bacterium GR16-43]|nr:HNH endonuclease [Betaproteobacteria bacterium GR16-43]
MRYWWVNQNQTFAHEVSGGYLWSPKRKRNGQQNAYYDFMRVVAPSDVVFSFADTRLKALGIARSHCYESPKPLEFDNAGAYWDQIGWRVDVGFVSLANPIRPADYIAQLRPHLPHKYAPLAQDGRGLQAVYLTHVNDDLARLLMNLIGGQASAIVQGRVLANVPTAAPAVGLAEWEEHELGLVRDDATLPSTEREAIVLARRGQGLFKSKVARIEKACRITRVDRIEHLIASHCKPWRDCSNEERLDGENGLLLTPNADHLFDRGFISFEGNGDLLISPVVHEESLRKLGVDPGAKLNVGSFSSGQRRYLEYHRDSVMLTTKFIR